MSVVIRLSRGGAKKAAYYKIVVADSRRSRDGRPVEQIGTYNPIRDEEGVRVDVERASHWLARGARPSQAVRRLFRKAGVSAAGAPTAASGDAPAVE
ncbi:MAG: 30S ribosomal protein S16 [Nitrospirota bacterium]|jgi:small subunit ribosomal protein S16